ncbi:Cell division control protein [Wickerhamomyces ciferrii]|uniref:Cell division control protein n=1 Tax=Wickerhamomyces ciferrii (strain ATCC 14091 / BCRC 22168 / CBS 111 / JCM 3599 / NBRC 0793 / NRRL Y-1031 F-60-10) TaxID=1206466 RepID=K0KM79_WICCF|nr:Cell division control protein [Wickerhamomyces ciferrii]CCH42223.1 Cell division control protein [Wickerhamomyces ciferrii]
MAVFPPIQHTGTSSSNVSIKNLNNINTNVVQIPSSSSIISTPGSIQTPNVALPVAGNNNTLMLMNKQVTSNDSLYYICLRLKKRLESVAQLKPYLNLAYSSAEVLSENQALLLSQKSSSSNGSGSRSSSSNNHHSFNSSNGTSSNFRVSAMSNLSSTSDEFSTTNSSPMPSPSSSSSPLTTFCAGVLPATVNCDPVTQLWALFQQGSPLCVIFNLIKPAYSLPVISSDDLKTCKKSIYDFILACKNYLNFENSELFTISNAFSNDTDDLIKIIKVINLVIDQAPNVFKPVELNNDDLIKITDSRSKVLKELVETERKYVDDLETLLTYKEQLLNQNIISSDDLYMLFPNLNDILDFQRRFLVALEINNLVDPKYQRIGSVFIHAQSFFKSYEPWSIGQKAAIDFINSSSMKLKNSSLIIENELELQSFLIKPVQRLCKYPLLLKELIKYTDSSNSPANQSSNFAELNLALEISKKIANDINENQRRVENVEVLKKLYDKVVDWKGYNVNSFGELLFFDKVIVKDNSKTSEEREFQVYLFENIIIFFKEILPQQKKSSITSLKKKSQTNLLNSNQQEILGLELKGRISIANIYNISTINHYLLNISWSGIKDTGSFLMKFKNEEIRTNWESCIRRLVSNLQDDLQNNNTNGLNNFSINNNTNERRSNGISMTTSNRSSYLSRSNSETASTINSTLPQFHQRQKSEVQIPQLSQTRRSTQDSIQSQKRSISESYKNQLPNNNVIVKLQYEKDLFTLMIPLDIEIDEFFSRLEKKIKQCGGIMKGKIKYQDEDGDFIVIQSDEDWSLVKEMIKEVGDKVLNVWVA